jgi:hypothetical protein
MNLKSVLPLTATIAPGASARVSTELRAAFRPERLLVSPHSFPLSPARRAWTWPLVRIGDVLGRAHRGLAKLLRVDPYAARERREYVSAEYARTHEVLWEESEEGEDEAEDRPFILVPAPLNRREGLLAPLGRASRRLSQVRLSWQKAQLATVLVRNITISRRPQLVDGAVPLPVDLFAAVDTFVNFNIPSCTVGQEIEIDVHNGNRRECRLMMTIIGTSKDDRAGEAALTTGTIPR